jgi:hypothetical protein
VLEHRSRELTVVDARVRAHDGPRAGLGDEPLERLEVHLAQRALVDAGEVARALRLGVVGDEVLDAHADAAVLRGLDHVHRDAARQLRVLRVALEVAAAHGRALQVDLRGEDEVDAVAAGLGGERSADLVGQVDVPRRGERARRGERRGRLGPVLRHAAHAGGAVGDVHRAQADPRDRGGRPQPGADDERHLLLDGQLADQRHEPGVGRVGTGRLGRRRVGGRAEAGEGGVGAASPGGDVGRRVRRGGLGGQVERHEVELRSGRLRCRLPLI